MIDLRSQQMIEHVHGSGEDDALIGLACLPSEDAAEEGLAHAGITDQHQVGALFQEGKVEQTKDAVFGLHAAFVVVEVEGADAGLRLQARALEATLDGAAVTSSMSASSSRVAETLRFRAAAAAIVASAWRLIAFRLSCSSFCSREVIAFLSGFENEGVIFQQLDGVGDEFVEQRITQPKRRLRAAW
jgi:hypothetical protein